MHPTLPIREVARKMRALNIGCLPIGADGRLVGILTDRDIVCRLVTNGRNADRTHVYGVMTRGSVSCFEDPDALEAAEAMRANGFHRLPVLDAREDVVGLLSLDDLCGKIPDHVFAATMQAIVEGRRMPVNTACSTPAA